MKGKMTGVAAVLAALLLLTLSGTIFASDEEETYEWPRSGFLTGTSVNLREKPSTGGKIAGRFASEHDGGELLVIARFNGGEEFPWYRVISAKFGEGWIYGKFLSVFEPGDPVQRYALKIRADFGVSPQLALKYWGEPTGRSERKQTIPDFKKTVTILTLTFHGHEAVYWDGVLQSVEIPGGPMGFGDILMGMDLAEATVLLGEPALEEKYGRVFISERDEIQLEFDSNPAGKGYVITGLSYRRVVYD